PPRRLVVGVDNASADDPCAALRAEFPWTRVIRNRVNGGWAGGNNVGIRAADADWVVLLNNDTVAAPDLAHRLLRAAEAHPRYAVLGPVIRTLEPPHEVMTDGAAFNRPGEPGFFPRREVPPTRTDPPTVAEVDVVNGCCLMTSAAALRRVGPIDERFFLVHEESDYCLRVRRAGWRCGVVAEALVWHKGSQSFARSGKRWQRYYDARNLLLLLHKH